MSGVAATPPAGGDGDYNWADVTNNWTDADATFLQERSLVRFDDTSVLVPTPGVPPDGTPANVSAGRMFLGRVKGTLVLSMGSSVWKNFLGSRFLKSIQETTAPNTASIVATGATTGIKFTDSSDQVLIPSLAAVAKNADGGNLFYSFAPTATDSAGHSLATEVPAAWLATGGPLRSELPDPDDYPLGAVFVVY